MDFEWDRAKAHANRVKHGVSFREGSTVFDDPFARTYADTDHSWDESRSITLGWSRWQRMLVVVHTNRGSRSIISARPATSRERRHYEAG